MSRRNRSIRREINPDYLYKSKIVTKLINGIMKDGKKAKAEKILYGSFEIIKQKTNKDPLEVFTDAINNIIPEIEVRSRRIGGANYQVPTEVSSHRKQTLALRWLINYSRLRNENGMEAQLAGEIIDAANGTGASVKKCQDTHKMAEANKAFAHYRW